MVARASLTRFQKMALFQGGCEFPLLRDRFWKLAAAGMPAEPEQQTANGSPSPGSKPRQQRWTGSSHSPSTPPLPEQRNGPPQARPSLRSAASLSVDLGSLQNRRNGGSGCLAPAFGGRELSRSESEAPSGRGRFGLRSLDLQVQRAGLPSLSIWLLVAASVDALLFNDYLAATIHA